MLYLRTKVDDSMLSPTETLQGVQAGNSQAILWVASLYFMACALYSLIFQWRIRQWPSVWGTLLQKELHLLMPDNDLSAQEYRAKVLYTYSIAGNVYEGRRLSPWVFVVSYNARTLLSKQIKGVTQNHQQQVKVFYNPQRPEKSYLILPGPAGMLITCLFGAFPLALYLLKYGL